MRVLHVTRRYWPAVGGVETFMRAITTQLATQHDVEVLAYRVDNGPWGRLTDSLRPPPTFEPFTDGAAQVTPLRVPLGRRALMAPLVSQVVPVLRRYAYGRTRVAAAALYGQAVAPVIARSARKADVIHGWGGDLLASAVVRAARLSGVPAIITPFAHASQWGDDRASAAAYRAADAIVALLDADAALYRELGVKNGRLTVTGVCSPGVRPGGGPALREQLQIAGPIVIFLGARRPYKGFDLLLEAAPRVAAACPDVTFAFVGPGDSLPQAQDSVRMVDVGSVDEEGKAAWLDAADLMCLPSQAEIFPVTVLEAWSVATPVLLSDIAPLRELVKRSAGGVCVRREPAELADQIIGLLGDRARLRELGSAGQRFWRAGHTVEAVTQRHEALYDRLINRGPGEPCGT